MAGSIGAAPVDTGPADAKTPEHAVGSGLQDLRQALHDTHENVRIRAVADLTATSDPRILPDLVDALHDQSAAVREAAAAALARLGNASALPALKLGLKNEDEDEWVRLRIAQAVAGLGDSDGIPILLELARRADAKVTRLEALNTLFSLADLTTDPPPANLDTEQTAALLQRLDRWWEKGKHHLRWDAASRSYRPGG